MADAMIFDAGAQTNAAETAALAAALAGDHDAFRRLTDPYTRELHVHCYRLLGSVQDAEDALQETLLRAWRHLATFQGRSSFRAWLYRIATNAALTERAHANAEPPRVLPVLAEAVASSQSFTYRPTQTRCWTSYRQRPGIRLPHMTCARASNWPSWRRPSYCRLDSGQR